jgi:Leucine-rich repeat (LRR) protein
VTVNYSSEKTARPNQERDDLSQLSAVPQQDLALHRLNPENIVTFSRYRYDVLTADSIEVTHGHDFSGTDGLEIITRFTNLESLTLQNCKIDDLTLLTDFINLRHLDLGGNNISDITPLRSLVNLETLVLERNSLIAQEQIDELQTALPNVEILL